MTNIILCGGSGTRLWPLSRTTMPKQFVKFFNNESLFTLTLKRNIKICDKTLIVSNQDQYFLASDQISESNLSNKNINFIIEPFGRNTAPAIALSCFGLDESEIVLVTPSDHLIKDEMAYQNAIKIAHEIAEKNILVTFGIVPTHAETGFGYIEAGKLLMSTTYMTFEGTIESSASIVNGFHEKPNLTTAQNYIKSGNFYWNSGMFAFKAGAFLNELKLHAPEIYDTAKLAYEKCKFHNKYIKISYHDMSNIPENSIDYAVLEHSKNIAVVPCEIGWSDLGSFDALSNELSTDENGNSIDQNLIAINSHRNFIHSHGRKIATIGVNDFIIIDTTDAVLIAKKGISQDVKKVVNLLKETDAKIIDTSTNGNRPWGSYTVLDAENGYKIKRIEVRPGKRLSLQKHFHRSEHWIVVSGTATVTIAGETKIVRQNESTYIRAGEVHRLANEGKIPVVLIEVQVGEYTGEDDIVRIEDDFERD